MTDVSLTREQLLGLNRLNQIIRKLDVPAWSVVEIPGKGWQFVLSGAGDKATKIHRRLGDAGIKTTLNNSGRSLLLDPEIAAGMTQKQQVHAWQRLSLEFGKDVAKARSQRLRILFAEITNHSNPSLKFDPASKSVIATIPLYGHLLRLTGTTFDDVQKTLRETGIKVGKGSRGYTIKMTEPAILALTPIAAYQGAFKLEKLILDNDRRATVGSEPII